MLASDSLYASKLRLAVCVLASVSSACVVAICALRVEHTSGGIASVCVGREREEESVCVGSERGRERRLRRRVVALVCFDELSGERERVEVEDEAPKDERKV